MSVAVPVLAAAVVLPAHAAHADGVRAAQWHLRTLDITRAHHISRGAGITVAVVDSGVDATHPDLTGNVAEGRDFVGETGGRVDRNGHGTGVAALIAAHGHGSGDGVLGLAPRATILPLRVSDERGRYSSADAARAVRWAADHGADVINVSGGASTDDPRLRQAVGYAESRDVVVVASAGNTDQGDRHVLYPAAYPGVVAVSAVDGNGEFSPQSVRGPKVALAAPGVKVVTAALRHEYAVGVGTSDAAALISGTAALVRAEYPSLDAGAVVNRLIRTADDHGPRGRDARFGYGIVDPVAALTADVPEATDNPLGSVAAASRTSRAPASAPPAASADGDGQPTRPDLLMAGLISGVAVFLACISLFVGGMLTLRRRRSRRARASMRPPDNPAANPPDASPPGGSPPGGSPPGGSALAALTALARHRTHPPP